MRRMKKTAVVALLGTAILASPAVANAGRWHRHHHPYVVHRHHVPGTIVGLGIAGAVLGTIAVVDSIVRPRVYYAPPPPPPPPAYYEDAYRRGYEEGRRDAYDDGHRSRGYRY